MGSGSWSSRDWDDYKSTVKAAPTATIFKSHTVKTELDPKGVTVRESRDSADNPNSTAIIVGLDVTGSMGEIAGLLAREGLGVLFTEILDRKPVPDPHLMFMAVGDMNCDIHPIQTSQFEADNRIIKQLTDIYLEGGGGGNRFESYEAPWYFAAQHTSIDCFEKRGKKGFIFTVGDEEAPPGLTKSQIKEFFGDDVQGDYSSKQLFDMVSKMYHVFHVIVEEGSHARRYMKQVVESWNELIGAQHVLRLSDHKKLSEVIVSAIQVVQGTDIKTVTTSWSDSTALVVAHALDGMSTSLTTTSSMGKGVTRL